MSGYSKMDLMRMSDDDLKKILKEEGDTLPGYLIAMIVDELELRQSLKDAPEDADGGDPLTVYIERKGSAEDGEDSDPDGKGPASEEDGDPDGEDEDAEGSAADEEPTDEELTDEERLNRDIEEAEKTKKERTRILIIASAAAGLTILALAVTLTVLYFTGQLKL